MIAAVRETLFSAEDFVQPTMPLELLQIGPNVRTDPGELEDLAASIREFGVLQPVKVQSTPDGWVVLWGQRRVLASRLAGLTEIPVIIAPPAAADLASLTFEQLVENLQRADLNDIDEARALRAILDANPGMTHDAVADKLGKSRPWVSNSLRLLGLDEAVQAKVATGEISGSHARALASLPPKQQNALASRIIHDKIPSRQVESELSWRAQEAANEVATAKRTEKGIPKAIAALEAAGVAKDVAIHIQRAYNLDQAVLEGAIKKAGWKVTREYPYERGAASKCDCKVVRLEFNRTWKVEPGCTEPKHRDRQRNVDHQAEEARRKAIAVRVAELRSRIRPLLDSIPLPILLLAEADRWGIAERIQAQLDAGPVAIRDSVADALVERVDASQVWNGRHEGMEKALETLIGMLEPVEPAAEPPAKASKPKAGRQTSAEALAESAALSDEPVCDWPGCTLHGFHRGDHDVPPPEEKTDA